jgi:hypothetical protein
MSAPSDDRQLLDLLESVLLRLDICVRHESLRADPGLPSVQGGLCRVRGRRVLFIDPATPCDAAITIIIDALRSLDLRDMYLPPAVRIRLAASPSDE